jgi:hypothetical protein
MPDVRSPPYFAPGFKIGAIRGTDAWIDERFMTGAADRDWHLTHTADKSLTEYAEEKRAELANSISHKRLIYLDQRYWIHCRDAASGKSTDLQCQIWNSLRRLVRNGQAVCPISADAVIETFKQSDTDSRLRTSYVMDELSGGIGIRSAAGRKAEEFEGVLRWLSGDKNLPPLKKQVLTPIIWEVFGELKVTSGTQAIGKAMFDLLSRMRFPDFVGATPDFPVAQSVKQDRIARDDHNKIAARHKNAKLTCKNRLDKEVQAAIRNIEASVRQAMLKRLNGRNEAIDRLMATLLTRLTCLHKEGQFKTLLPTAYVSAAIYAAIDHKRRRFEDGDFFDHRHATAALPYCDLFLTERKLGTLLSEKPAQLDQEYGCIVIWNEMKVLEHLHRLEAEAP